MMAFRNKWLDTDRIESVHQSVVTNSNGDVTDIDLEVGMASGRVVQLSGADAKQLVELLEEEATKP